MIEKNRDINLKNICAAIRLIYSSYCHLRIKKMRDIKRFKIKLIKKQMLYRVQFKYKYTYIING